MEKRRITSSFKSHFLIYFRTFQIIHRSMPVSNEQIASMDTSLMFPAIWRILAKFSCLRATCIF